MFARTMPLALQCLALALALALPHLLCVKLLDTIDVLLGEVLESPGAVRTSRPTPRHMHVRECGQAKLALNLCFPALG